MFVFDDVDASGTANSHDEVGVAKQIAYIDLNKNGSLDNSESYELTDSSGVARFETTPLGEIAVRVVGATRSVFIDTSNPTAPSRIELPASQSLDNHAPSFTGELSDQQITENGELDLAINLLSSIAADDDGDPLCSL